jgi:DNA-binding NarL/FixJ family response regulator
VCTVLIVDDHAEFRESASALLEAAGFTVVGAAADGASAIAQVVRSRPDVVLVDVQLPDLDGFEVAARLAAIPAPPRVVLVSSRDLGAYGRRSLPATVRGFISKDDLSGAALAALVR